MIDPATEEVVTEIALASTEETDAAIDAADSGVRARGAAVAPADRGRLLRRFADAVDGAIEELAQLEVRNAGHTIGNARWEAGNVRDVLDYYAAAPERLFGRQIPVAGGLDVTFKEPLGVVGVIVPWNFPMPIAGWGFAPALAAGNTRRAQAGRADPADRDPARRARARGRPAPRRLHGAARARARSSASGSSRHPAVRKVCFTGSTEVGQADHGAAPPTR